MSTRFWRNALLYPFLALFALALDLSCKFGFNWIVAIFAVKEGNLPRCLYWFQTFDNNCDRGAFSRERDILNGQQHVTTWGAFWPWPTNALQRYWNRAAWLFRNTAYGFDYYLLGMQFRPENWRCIRYEKTAERELEIHVGDGFNIRYRGRWGNYKLGWKATNCYDPATGTYPRQWGDQLRIPLTISINPCKRL